MKHALVAGAAGFLGSHFVDALVERGWRVTALDNFSTGNLKNLAHLPRTKDPFAVGYTGCYEVDITDNRELDYLFGFENRNSSKFDVIFNAACPASPPVYQKNPIVTMETCFIGTKNLLKLARDHEAKFIHCATSEAYGDPDVSPQSESYRGNVSTTGIRACYDEGKRISETLCAEYHRLYGVPTKIVRIFNTYGPRMDPDDGRVVTNFIKQALLGKSFTLYGGGTQTRSFCYVSDLVAGFMKVMDTPDSFVGPINLGNPNEFTIYDLAKQIHQKLRHDRAFDDLCINLPLPEDDPKQRRPDISMAKTVLGWEPVIELSEGLDKTIEYISSVLLKPF